jgi:hypothetical protein
MQGKIHPQEPLMTATQVFSMIQHDANDFQLLATDALAALTEIVGELSERINEDDIATLVAVGSLIYRDECTHRNAVS